MRPAETVFLPSRTPPCLLLQSRFVADVAPITTAIWKPALIAGWSADVLGLLALSFSFGAARRAIDRRRAALHAPEAPSSRTADLLNAAALWSFPLALLCLFAFVTANVVQADAAREEPTASVTQRNQGGIATTQGTSGGRAVQALDGGGAGPTRALPATTGTPSRLPVPTRPSQEIGAPACVGAKTSPVTKP